MGIRKTDPIEDRRRFLMRQGAAQTNKYGIGGLEKQGHHAPRPITLPKLPWDDEPAEVEKK